MNKIFAYSLDWNPITVEAFDERKKEAYMIFNFDITAEQKIESVVQYVVGRTVWGYLNFPSKSKIILRFDIRGQNLVASESTSLKNDIQELLSNLNINNQVLIEFYR